MRLRLGEVCFSFSFFFFPSTESQLWTKSGRHAFSGIGFVYFVTCFPNSLTKHVILLGYLLYLRILSWYYFFRASSYLFSWSFNPHVWPLKTDRRFSAKCYFYQLPCPYLITHSPFSGSISLTALYSPWNSLGQNTGMDSLSLLQGIFLAQRIEPRSPALQADS